MSDSHFLFIFSDYSGWILLPNHMFSRFKCPCSSLKIGHFYIKGCTMCEWSQIFEQGQISRMFTQNWAPFKTEIMLYILGTKPSAILSNHKLLQ
jgi:hypothetical protein